MNWITPLLNDYHSWIKNNTLSKENPGSGWVTIQTPFIGIYNDNLEIYAKMDVDTITLSDDGVTVANLGLLGVNLNKGERKSITEKILFNYGVSLTGNQLTTHCKISDFPQKKHNLLSAMIELNDLAILSSHNIANIFKDDVREYIDQNNIVFTPDFISKGQTGLEFTFDFQITSRESELVIKSFNSLNKQNLLSFLFGWEDIKPIREKATKKEVRAIAVINDEKKPVAPEYLDALTSKKADFILWTNRNTSDSLKKLVA